MILTQKKRINWFHEVDNSFLFHEIRFQFFTQRRITEAGPR